MDRPPAERRGKPWSTSFLSLDPMSIHLALRIISAVALVLAGCFIACAAQTLVREMGACGGRKGGGCCTCLFVMVGLVLSGAAGVAHLMPPQTFVPQWVLIAIPQVGATRRGSEGPWAAKSNLSTPALMSEGRLRRPAIEDGSTTKTCVLSKRWSIG